MIHLCSLMYKLKKDDPWKRGVATLEAPGLSNVLCLIDEKGYPVTAPDGGSCAIFSYELTPWYGAMSVLSEDD